MQRTNRSVQVVGILNVTPDSFYDGGHYPCIERALERAMVMVDEGADIIDVGGESTRPGAIPVGEAEEMDRVLPLIEALTKAVDTPVSIDTRRANVAEVALLRGASWVNAVAGLEDSRIAAVCAEHRASLVINHMRGTPETMQQAPQYRDVVAEVCAELKSQAGLAEKAGVERSKIWLDPGIGFGKASLRHNLPLLAHLNRLVVLGYPVLVGVSRKHFIGELTGANVEDRLAGSIAAGVAAVMAGASALRVHDVAATRDAVRVAAAIREARG